MKFDSLTTWALRILFGSIAIFIAVDIIMTYIGVCIHGGTEINILAVKGAQAIGYVPFTAIFYLSIVVPMFFLLRRLEKRMWAKLVIILAFIGLFIFYLQIIIHNVMMVSHESFGTKVNEKFMERLENAYITVMGGDDYMEKVNSTFERGKFCKLFPSLIRTPLNFIYKN